jgi:DNA-binding IclR family transcriptional regulator
MRILHDYDSSMPSITRTVRVLELLARNGPLGVRAIAQQLNLPLGSVHRILLDLAKEMIIERSSSGVWEISYRLLEIVGIQLERLQLPHLTHPFLEALAAETGETSFLAVPSGDEIVYLDKVQTDLQLQLNAELGTRRPMHCTGLGKAILAFLPDVERNKILDSRPLDAYTANTITEPERLRRQLALVRQRGYSIDRGEIISGVECVAVPILNHAGRPVGAISVAGTKPKVEGVYLNSLLRMLTKAGDHVNRRLGFRGGRNLGHIDGFD